MKLGWHLQSIPAHRGQLEAFRSSSQHYSSNWTRFEANLWRAGPNSNNPASICFKIVVISLRWQIFPRHGPSSKICTRFKESTTDRFVSCQQICQSQHLVHIPDLSFLWNIGLEIASVWKLMTGDESEFFSLKSQLRCKIF